MGWAEGLNSAKNDDAKIGNDFHKQAPLCWKPSPNFPELTSRLFPISSSQLPCKGQIIPEGIFGVFKSPKKRKKTIRLELP